MNDLFEQSKQQLVRPLRDSRRRLLIILNICYVLLLTVYVTFDKISTGSFVPDPSLYFAYIPAFLLNLFSAFYNIQIFRFLKDSSTMRNGFFERYLYNNREKIDSFVGWVSIIPIMFMNFCNIIGLGNPSNDAIFADYTLATSLIIGAVIIVGRKAAIIWTLIVVFVLLWDVTRLGWNYEYHYLTPSEASAYKESLTKNESHALQRKIDLEKHGLNPPKVTRYFSAWMVYIIIAFMAAYFFSGLTIDIFRIIPSVISNIEMAMEDRQRIQIELEQKQREITKSALRILRYNEIMEEMNEEIDRLDYQEKKKLIRIINVMRRALDEETEWEKFETNFNLIQNDFFKIIKEKHPNLTRSEMRHMAYVRMNISSVQISKLMNVKIESLRTLRYRLKKKLNIGEELELIEYIETLEVQTSL